ncbi:MAG: RNase adapter RapZ [Pseudomonadota bacterium]
MRIVLISGLSGSGKSIALNVLEDAAYYCIDNLPARLLPQVVDFLQQAGYTHAAISIDARSGGTYRELPQQVRELAARGIEVRMLFLEAKTDALVKRFSETRRRHPLSDSQLTLPECIERERELLSEVIEAAHRIDTSDLSPNSLRAWIKEFIGIPSTGLTLLFQSFGFKHGIPLDADMVFDVRCLPNPHYDPLLRPLTGKDRAVVDFLAADTNAQAMLVDIRGYVEKWLPAFVRDNRSYLSIAIGCTGGQHRSVYFAEALARHFRSRNEVLIRHRELVQP